MVDEVKSGSDGGNPAVPSEAEPPSEARTTRLLTIPNIISALRVVGSIVLIPLACTGRHEAFLWLFIILAMTDWVDGKLAILLNQRSVFGARLDGWADVALYGALLFGAVWLRGETLQSELAWIISAVASYVLSTLAGFWKYHRWPSYHTRAAKTSWFLILVGAGCLLGGWAIWPLRLALAAVTVTNLEALLITILSPSWRADVGSVIHVLRKRGTR